jgi:hypothetical protein
MSITKTQSKFHTTTCHERSKGSIRLGLLFILTLTVDGVEGQRDATAALFQ